MFQALCLFGQVSCIDLLTQVQSFRYPFTARIISKPTF